MVLALWEDTNWIFIFRTPGQRFQFLGATSKARGVFCWFSYAAASLAQYPVFRWALRPPPPARHSCSSGLIFNGRALRMPSRAYFEVDPAIALSGPVAILKALGTVLGRVQACLSLCVPPLKLGAEALETGWFGKRATSRKVPVLVPCTQ